MVQTNEFLKNILDSSSSVSIVSTDLEQNICFWNKGAENLFGYTADEVVGEKKITILYPSEDENDQACWFRSEIVHSKKSLSFEMPEINKDGDQLWIKCHISPRLDENGKVIGLLGIGEDITEQKTAELEKAELQSQLLQAQKLEAIGTLAGGIAHDFNNLLMGIQGNSSLALLDVDPEGALHDYLKSIEMLVKSGSTLTKQLMGLTRGGMYDIRPDDMNELVTRTAYLFGRTKKEIRITFDLAEDLWAVEIDRSQFEQVLINIFLNAWQAMSGAGTIHIKTHNLEGLPSNAAETAITGERQVAVTITDTGIGIDAATREKIFDPFFTTKVRGKERGTGLGLATVYGIVKSHEGRVTVDSEAGNGATFTIVLPASEKTVKGKPGTIMNIKTGSGTILGGGRRRSGPGNCGKNDRKNGIRCLQSKQR